MSYRLIRFFAAWLVGALLLGGLAPLAPAQAQRLVAPWQLDPVLSPLLVQQLVFAPDGYVWVATDDGVRRYDGYAAVPLARLVRSGTVAAPGGYVRLALASDGAVWIGAGNGLFCFVPATGQLTQLGLPAPAGETAWVTALWRDERTNRLWVGYGWHRLAVIQLGQPVRLQVLPSLGSQAQGIAAGSAGTVWVATEQPLAVFDARGNLLRQLPHPPETLAPVPGTWPQQLVSSTALFELDSVSGQLRELRRWAPALHQYDARVAPAFDSLGRPIAWLVGGQRIILRWPRGNNGQLHVQQTRVSINPADSSALSVAPRLYTLQRDPRGLWWAFSPDWRGSYRALARPLVKALLLPVVQPSVRCFTRLPTGELLLSSYAGTWLQVRPDSAAPFREMTLWLRGQPWRHTLYHLLTTCTGRVLAALPGEGFAELDPHTGRLTLLAPAKPGARTLLQDSRGQLWGGADDGLYQLDEARQLASPSLRGSALRGTAVRALATDARGTLWLATNRGVYALPTAPGLMRHYGPTEAGTRRLPTADVTCVAPTADGLVWLGTREGSLLALAPQQGVVRHLTPLQGLPDAPVATLLPDLTGALWAGTYAGLVRYAPGPDQLTVYGLHDGLPDLEFNQQAARAEPDGTLLFGGIGGLVRVRPARLAVVPGPAPSLLVATDGPGAAAQPLPPTVPGLVLATWHQELRLSLALTDFHDPATTRFFYQLSPKDEPAGDVNATGPSLRLYAPAPGDYTLAVWGRTADGRRSQVRRLPLSVGRPWWQHPAALASGALLLLVLGAAAQWGRSRRQLHDARLRTRIAADLHDEVGALLTRVSMRAELLHSTGGPAVAATSPNLEALLRDSRAAQATMRDLVWGIDAGADTLGALLDRLRDHLDQMAPAGLHTNLVVHQLPDTQLLAPALRQHLYLLAKEAITNAVCHAAGATELRVELGRRGPALYLRVTDNGRLTESPPGAGGMGLRSMRQRAQALGGQLTTGPRADGAGWEVLLKLPPRRSAG